MGPMSATTNSLLEFNQTSTSLGFLDLDTLTSSAMWVTSATVYPNEDILRLKPLTTTSYELTLSSTLSQAKTFVVAVTARSGDFQVQQVVMIKVQPQRRSMEVLDIFLVQGTRKDTVIADLSRNTDDGTMFQIEADDDTVKALFTVTQDGKIVCGRDINLDEVTNNNSIAHEYSFNVTSVKGSTSDGIAKLNILIFKDKFHSSVRENRAGVIMTYSLSETGNFQVKPIDVPAFAQISANGKSIKLSDGLDFDSAKEKVFTFEVDLKTKDNSKGTSIAVMITITDENDETPVMITNINGEKPILDYYIFEVLAGSPEKTIIGVVTSSDRDTLGTTSYILGGTFKDSFVVDAFGTIRSTSPLKKSIFGTQFNLTVSVSDGVSRSAPVNAVIFLTSLYEVDNNLNMVFTAFLLEEQPKGGDVTNVSVKNYINYNFTNYFAMDMFTIDSSTGIIKTRRSLDRETDRTPTDFSIQAVLDTEDQCQLVIIGQLIVTIEDVNDHPPRFSKKKYSARVTEGMLPGISILGLVDVEVYDDDEGQNAAVTVSLNGSDSKYFEVETVANRFTIKTSNIAVDLETLSSDTLTFTVIAKNDPLNATERRSSTADIEITVQDVNDNTPVFSSDSVVNVQEESSASQPSHVANVSATDADTTNNEISYYLASGGAGFFAINSVTGELKTTRKLDRESEDTYTLSVHAVDNGKPPRTGSASLTVNVTDVNDNAPVFSERYVVRVTENACSPSLVTVVATDADSGRNGEVTYSIKSDTPDRFDISSNGQLRCTKSLDFEVEKSHLITLIATDKGTPPLSSELAVNVEVEDVNDNSPLFGSPSYTTTMKRGEWSGDKPILVIHVSDEDSGPNGQISLSLSSSKDKFYIVGGNIGVLRVQPDAPKPLGPTEYVFNVTATDGGGRQGQTTVTVDVSADDTSAVRFEGTDYVFSMEEDTDYSSRVIGTVQTDPGVTVEYSIVNEPDFLVDKTTGDITCTEKLDRETESSRVFVIRAQETSVGGPADLAVVNITITDINDNTPKFTGDDSSYFFTIAEDARSDDRVALLSAVDEDDGVNALLEYTVESQTPSLGFKIDKSSGWITVSGSLNREQISEYTLTIKVSDKGTPPKSATTTATIYVNDINDVKPSFNQTTYAVSVKEWKPVGETVLTLTAADGDFSDNGTVRYEVQSATNCPLAISGKGEITLAKELDYEVENEYECVILAKDMATRCETSCPSQLTGTTTVTVQVNDNNDNAPVFQNTSYVADVSRNAAIDYIVTKIRATDADDTAEGNDVVKYFILSEQDYFAIGRDSGEITVKSSLQNIEDDTFRLVVEARDTPQIDPEMKTQTNVLISIISDKPRPFFNKTYSLNLNEHDEPTDAVLVQTKAYIVRRSETVACNRENDCTYSIEKSDAPGAFSINADTGELRQVEELDRDHGLSTIIVKVKVVDKVTNESRTTNVRVDVLDINDNFPYFENPAANFDVKHSASVDFIIGTLTSKDDDSDSVSVYKIRDIDNTTDLKIGLKRNGSLFVREPLVSFNGTIKFDVIVEDNKTIVASRDTVTPRNNQQRVSVEVRSDNFNENAPRFTKAEYQGSVISLARKNTPVDIEDLKALDADNNTVKYTIMEGNIRETFTINTTTAELTLQYDLDGTIPDIVTLHVVAVDEAYPPKTGSCVVKITLIDPTPTQCIRQSEFEFLSERNAQRTLFLGVFIGLAVLLTVVIIFAIVATYKWRKAAAVGARYRASAEPADGIQHGTARYDPLQAVGKDGGYDGLQNKDFSAGVRNPGYVTTGTTDSRTPCAPPTDPFPEPVPDY